MSEVVSRPARHQLTLMLCDPCWRSLAATPCVALALLRASHRSSFWCEHDLPEDWHPGFVEPVLIYIGRKP